MRCGDARVEEADSDDWLFDLPPGVQREIGEEPRPSVRHAFGGDPPILITTGTAADRRGAPHHRLALQGGERVASHLWHIRFLPAHRWALFVELRPPWCSRNTVIFRPRRGDDGDSKAPSSSGKLSNQPDSPTSLG